MKKFILHLYQGNGCDYTIACGETLIDLEAKDIDAARADAKEKIEDYGRENIEYVTIYEVAYEEKPEIDDLFAEDDAAEAKRKKEAIEREEMRILSELRKKYPDA